MPPPLPSWACAARSATPLGRQSGAGGWGSCPVWTSACPRSAYPAGGTFELTGQELRLLPISDDSTAGFPELRWEVASNEPEDDGAPGWLNAAKLQELGFDCRVPVASPHARDHYHSVPPVLLYVVLEFEGEAWKKTGGSRPARLFVVDLGRDGDRPDGFISAPSDFSVARGPAATKLPPGWNMRCCVIPWRSGAWPGSPVTCTQALRAREKLAV